jgi:hypothetical protein
VKFIVVTGFLLLFSSISFAQPKAGSCSQDEVNRKAAELQLVRQRLLGLSIGDGLQTDVSPQAQAAIASMKDALGNFINVYLRCVPLQPDAAKVSKELSSLGQAFSLPPGVLSSEQIPADFGKFGFELSFDVKVIEKPRLIGVAANFSIECGSDTVLLIFSRSEDLWKEALRWQKKPYKRVDGGTIAFDFGISPPDGAGQWFVVTHDVAPWCSSTWSAIRYDVLRPTTDPLRPKVLLSSSDGMWWGNEDFGTLTVEKDDFDLRFHSSSIDGGVHNRVWIRHYSVVGDTVQRTQPVAVSPRDFVDEWLISPWRQASQWSSKAAAQPLSHAHRVLARKVRSGSGLLEFDSIQRCSDSSNHYQVEIGEEFGPEYKDARSFYFQVLGKDKFTMARVSEKPDPGCKGPNILEEMSTQ